VVKQLQYSEIDASRHAGATNAGRPKMQRTKPTPTAKERNDTVFAFQSMELDTLRIALFYDWLTKPISLKPDPRSQQTQSKQPQRNKDPAPAIIIMSDECLCHTSGCPCDCCSGSKCCHGSCQCCNNKSRRHSHVEHTKEVCMCHNNESCACTCCDGENNCCGGSCTCCSGLAAPVEGCGCHEGCACDCCEGEKCCGGSCPNCTH